MNTERTTKALPITTRIAPATLCRADLATKMIGGWMSWDLQALTHGLAPWPWGGPARALFLQHLRPPIEPRHFAQIQAGRELLQIEPIAVATIVVNGSRQVAQDHPLACVKHG